MAKKSITLTEEHIALLKNLNFKKLDLIRGRKVNIDEEEMFFGYDTYDIYRGTFLFEDMAHILGYADQVIKGTEEDPDGPKYPYELQQHMLDLDAYIVDNLIDIENLIHQRIDKGGIQPNVKYVPLDHVGLWYTEEEFKELKGK